MNRQKEEALKRMKKLKLMDDVINLFENEDKLYYSERQNKMFPAVLYWLDNEPKYVKMVNEFEKKTGNLVYHVILTHTIYGDILDFLYVSKYEKDWAYDNKNIENNIVFSMANNLTDDMLSDMGSIKVKPVMGGLERIA